KSRTTYSSRKRTSRSSRQRIGCTRSRRCWSQHWETDMPRIVIALGGNALLKRDEPMTTEAQRGNVKRVAQALAPSYARQEVVIPPCTGPQVGRLALQDLEYDATENAPLDVLDAQTEGSIGYMIEQELGNVLPFEVPFATLLTMVEVDAADPAFKNPTK